MGFKKVIMVLNPMQQIFASRKDHTWKFRDSLRPPA